MKYLQILLLVLFPFIILGCNFTCTENALFSVESFQASNSFKKNISPIYIEYVDSNFNVCSVEWNSQDNLKDFVLDVPKNMAVPVVLKDENQNIIAGTIYPYKNVLSQKDSFASHILLTLYCGSYCDKKETCEFVSYFNWKRFMEECNKFEDPWLLDKERILRKIAAMNFSKTDMRLR